MSSLELVHAANVQIRRLIGEQLVRVCFGTGLRLGFGLIPFRELVIECPLQIEVPGSPAWFGGPVVADVAKQLLPSLLSPVADAAAGPDGSFSLILDSQSKILVPASESFEAWQFYMNDEVLVVSTPGGKLAVWAPR